VRFPQLQKLDGVNISPQIMVEVIEDGIDLSQLNISDISEVSGVA
jgi:hypothetical protein